MIKTWPTLYKLTNGGKVQTWAIGVADYGYGRYPLCTVLHGQQNGKIQQTITEVKSGKNIGKSNETTPLEQCILEAEALWIKQKDRKGYTETIPESKPFLPMLAHSYDKQSHKVKWPAILQPKLDGICCLAWYDKIQQKVVMMSRAGKPFNNNVLAHLVEELELLLKGTDIVLHGELYNHELKDDFQTIVSGIKRDEPNEHSEKIQYHVYDIVDEELQFHKRNKVLTDLLFNSKHDFSYLKVVSSILINNEQDLKIVNDQYLANGYEGSMIKNLVGMYKINGRSYDLLKYKQFDDDEFEIVGAEQNKGKQSNQCSILCKTKSGTIFAVKPKGTDEQREAYWNTHLNNKLVGKMLTVRYFGYTTGDNPVPRFPIGVSLRDYE